MLLWCKLITFTNQWEFLFQFELGIHNNYRYLISISTKHTICLHSESHYTWTKHKFSGIFLTCEDGSCLKYSNMQNKFFKSKTESLLKNLSVYQLPIPISFNCSTCMKSYMTKKLPQNLDKYLIIQNYCISLCTCNWSQLFSLSLI